MKLLKRKDFGLLMFGWLCSLLGSNMQQFALSLYALEKTGSATVFASILAIIVFPRIILTPVAGVFGDWFDRKKAIVFLDFLSSLILFSFAMMFYINKELTIPMIYVLVILLEITEMFFVSAMAPVVPSIVEEENLAQANAISAIVMNMGITLAPIVAIFLYATLGLGVLLIFSSILFLSSCISEIFIHIPKNHKIDKELNFNGLKKDFLEGIKVTKSNKTMVPVITVVAFFNFLMESTFLIGITFALKQVLKINDIQFGIYQTVIAVAVITGPMISATFASKIDTGKLFYKSVIITASIMGVLGLFLSKSFLHLTGDNYLIPYIIVMVIMFIIYNIQGTMQVSFMTLVHKLTPINMLGRVGAILNLILLSSEAFGRAIMGSMYDLFPISIVIVITSIVCILLTRKYKKVLMNTK